MPRNKLSDLNNHLFEVLEMLKDDDITLDKAKAIVGVSDQIIKLKKVEVQQARLLLKAGYRTHLDGFLLDAGDEYTPQKINGHELHIST